MTRKEQLNKELQETIIEMVPMREEEAVQFMRSNSPEITFMRMNGKSAKEIAEKLFLNTLKGI